MKKFNKSYLIRSAWEVLDGTNTIKYNFARVLTLENYKFIVEDMHCVFIDIYKDGKMIAILHFGDFALPNDFTLLEIANSIISYPVETLAFQNSISKESGYLKVSNEYFLVNCDPSD